MNEIAVILQTTILKKLIWQNIYFLQISLEVLLMGIIDVIGLGNSSGTNKRQTIVPREPTMTYMWFTDTQLSSYEVYFNVDLIFSIY